ncbi:hypothetical protein MIB92_10525 [Aestuariirhabdus sp. Z084]|uniref:hypothetical protein n=1 Tax=Aestuariirhabdus haliotis TaxID=2918751 RepID=UPI00201B3CD5|nr:hypothetical protein [Aestuariirhabdus haliotis]MCL6416089.1 hypothetical protein [Aestuariirhabdus haliotis]MCL6419343.1 hypothetical protein [Aestuariirhabdus haliotis]
MKLLMRRYVALVCLSLLLLVGVVACYFPFVGGGFLFDDHANLNALVFIDGSWQGYWDVIFSNRSGPTGRPVSIASFALQADSWPSRPDDFQFANIVIHAINTVLVFCLLCMILTELKKRNVSGLDRINPMLAAFLLALLWAVHPGQVSSVLYIVQRMNLLAVFFGLLGLCFLTVFLFSSSEERGQGAGWLRSLSLGGVFCLFLVLSVFSKENGILFAGLLLLVYFIIYAPKKPYHNLVKWLTVAVVVGGVFLLAFNIDRVAGWYDARPYTLTERLMTQVVVVLEYFGWFLLPNYKNYYFYHDNYTLVKGWVDYRYLTAICIWLFFFVVARKNTLLQFGIVWFLVSHLLESTMVPLEIVFEHRNYLASIGLVAIFLYGFVMVSARLSHKVATALMFVFIGWTLINYAAVANTWQSREKMVVHWADMNPESIRLLSFKANTLASVGEVGPAKDLFEEIIRRDKQSVYGYLLIMELGCNGLPVEFDWLGFEERVGEARFEIGLTNALSNIVEKKETGLCDSLAIRDVWAVTQMLRNNQNLLKGSASRNYDLIEGRLCLLASDFDCFLQRYQKVAIDTGQHAVLKFLFAAYRERYGDVDAEKYQKTIINKIENN